MEFDGYMRGDVVQYYKGAYTRVSPAREVMKKSKNVSKLYGSPMFGHNVWNCFQGSTAMARAFNPDWNKLDNHVEITRTAYFNLYEGYYGGGGFDGEWRS